MRRQALLKRLQAADFLLVLDLVNILITLPLLRLLFSWLLNRAQVTLLSLTGITEIVTGKPFLALLIVLSFGLAICVACWEVKLVDKHYQVKTSPLFLLWLPWLALLFRTPLFALTQWPSFLLSHLERSWPFACCFTVFYLTAFVFLKNKKRLLDLWRPVLVQLLVGVLCYIVCLRWPRFLAASIFCLELVGESCRLLFLIDLLGIKNDEQKRLAWLPAAAFVLLALPIASMLAVPAHKPLFIAHRGVSQANGVQNTIPVLKKTSRQHPAYVEIDLHETRDGFFVVMHDDKLINLAGVAKCPYELTLSQLKKIKLHENGQTAHIASFADYLNTAHKLHQKLLIEIKTTPHDSKQMLTNFVRRYDRRLHGDLLQSADLGAVNRLRSLTKRPVFYIESYNLTYPQNRPTGFSMDYSSFNTYFYSQTKKPVYLWTPDSGEAIRHALTLRPAGIITDNLPLARQKWRHYRPQWQLVAYLLPLLF